MVNLLISALKLKRTICLEKDQDKSEQSWGGKKMHKTCKLQEFVETSEIVSRKKRVKF